MLERLDMSALGKKLRRQEGGRVAFWCPGCETAHDVGIEAPATVIWGFNGNGDAPTFTPSVLLQTAMWEPPVTPQNIEEWKRAPWNQVKVNKVCHSFVTDGRIQFLSDCTHKLVGQTVDLPDFDRERKA